MIHLLIAIASIIFIIAFAFRNKWQFEELRWRKFNAETKVNYPHSAYASDSDESAKKANKKWHSWQAVIQVCFFAIIGLSIGEVYGLVVSLLYLSMFWLLFDGILNKIAFNKPFFFVGTTAFIDRQFQRFKKPQLTIAIVKVILIAIFSTLYLIKAL